jgi:N-acetylmuramoyl-L-alanine amidase
MDPDLPGVMLFIGRAADGIFRPDEIGRMGPASSVNNRAGKFRKAAKPVADEGIEETRAFLSDLARSARRLPRQVWGKTFVKQNRQSTAVASRMPAKSRDKSSETSRQAAERSARRTWLVLGSLVGMLGFTGALLRALAPAPLTPDAPVSLFAVGPEQSIDRIFETATPVRDGRWTYIYVHHSRTSSGNALTLGEDSGGLTDHFLIGNGNGLTDGAVQAGPRWGQQLPAIIPGMEVDPNCISVCMVGDFTRSRPTPTQQARLVELLKALQRQLGIPASRVVLRTDDASAAGTGSAFPAGPFRSQLLP